jgi:hypothetical protein
MSDAYITLWNQPQVESERRVAAGRGDKLDHTANRQFRARNVQPGDRIYVLATRDGRILLLGRMIVEELTDQARAEQAFGPGIYEAPDHLIGRGSTLELDREVPEAEARRLRRVPDNPIPIEPDRYRVKGNALRTTGRITEGSAAILDAIIDGPVVIRTSDDGVYTEGERRLTTHERVERSPKVRARALAIHGTTCSICGFSFAEAYGPLGAGFAEVHHLVPLSATTKAIRVDPRKDVAVVCANCHRMLHRRSPPLTLEVLKNMLGI